MSAIQQAASAPTSPNDYHQISVTEKQLAYARQISIRSGIVMHWKVQQNRYALSL